MNLEEKILSGQGLLGEGEGEGEERRRREEGETSDYDREDGDHSQPSEEEEEEDLSSLPEPVRRARGAQTGAKGVLADKRAFEEEKRRREEREIASLLDKITKAAITLRGHQDQDDELDLEDDDFLQEYERGRMQQMMNVAHSRKRFGDLKEIKIDDYLEVVDKTGKDIPVIIHLRHHKSEGCARMSRALEEIAKRCVFARFVEIPALEVDPKYPLVALPTLLVYVNGDLVVNLTHATEELPDEFDAGNVEALLLGRKAIGPGHYSLQ